MAAIDFPAPRPFWQRLIFAVPLFGWMAREMAEGDADTWYYAAGALFSMWGCSILLFGVPGLYIPALAAVPVMFLLLILISRG
ncbi:MAG: hypothetical protein AB3N21_10535 [Ruegeria sp.]|uniref:hypothetical protein n=1 Tax=Ruegeria sp. TaxID=1879320 RepID=UPI00349EFDED